MENLSRNWLIVKRKFQTTLKIIIKFFNFLFITFLNLKVINRLFKYLFCGFLLLLNYIVSFLMENVFLIKCYVGC